MMRTVAIVQARMTSTRLPGKLLLDLAGAPVLQRMLERVRRIAGLDAVCVCVPEGAEHDSLVELATAMPGIAVTRGPEHDVLKRYLIAAEHTGADRIMRITSDCPLLDPAASASVLAVQAAAGTAYARTAFNSGWPLGLDTEVFLTKTLRIADVEAADPYEREHVTPFIWRRPDRFAATYVDRWPDRRAWRLTLDYRQDYDLIRAIYDALYPGSPDFDFTRIEDLLLSRPELLAINATVEGSKFVNIPGIAK